jgi:hypothetical protein
MSGWPRNDMERTFLAKDSRRKTALSLKTAQPEFALDEGPACASSVSREALTAEPVIASG